ncbi:hypothetical protein LCGC14_2450330 [marine sediment metagenome]|uniref:Uncharacterized protein n=1 Tax=marine sediment metagenome TaxID=412755 RepID=A0A0F9BGC7_9ZZZZ
MGGAKNRSHADTDWLKARAREYAMDKGMSDATIRDILSKTEAAGDQPVTQKALHGWLLDTMTEGETRESMHSFSFSDVMYLRGRAFRAAADTEVNRAYIMERAYWWGLYISSLHIVLRSALTLEGGAALPPQFIVANLDQWYEDLRALRQLTPRLHIPPEEVDRVQKELDEFEKHYGRDIRLPKETL